MKLDNAMNFSPRGNRTRSGQGMLSAVLLVVFLCGCAGVDDQAESEVYRYNRNSDFPPVGVPHMSR